MKNIIILLVLTLTAISVSADTTLWTACGTRTAQVIRLDNGDYKCVVPRDGQSDYIVIKDNRRYVEGVCASEYIKAGPDTNYYQDREDVIQDIQNGPDVSPCS